MKKKANAYECLNPECTIIQRLDACDLEGDICANCGEQSVRLVFIDTEVE